MGKLFLLICFVVINPIFFYPVVREIDHKKINSEWVPTNGRYPMRLSILIPSLPQRKECFDYIANKLKRQLSDNALEEKVEILTFIDNREFSIGFKRNVLLRQSQGEYVAFVDDDDDISDTYIRDVYDQLVGSPDCIAIKGMQSWCGRFLLFFFQSIKFNRSLIEQTDKGFSLCMFLPIEDYRCETFKQWDGEGPVAFCDNVLVQCRFITIWNPIKRSIAVKFSFPDVSRGEDCVWCRNVIASDLLKTENMVKKLCYHYNSWPAGAGKRSGFIFD